jgi:Mg-chelatase subunit ChlI
LEKASIIHFTNNWLESAQLPAIWFLPNSDDLHSNKFHIRFSGTGYTDVGLTNIIIPSAATTEIQINAVGHQVEVLLNGAVTHYMELSGARTISENETVTSAKIKYDTEPSSSNKNDYESQSKAESLIESSQDSNDTLHSDNETESESNLQSATTDKSTSSLAVVRIHGTSESQTGTQSSKG